ncbi:MAG: sigma factor-like helix-turn-helix DNA-binding protein, partial [Ilumatobacteraceae bacterium]
MTNRKTSKRATSRRTPTVHVPSNAVAILQVLEPKERRIMSLRWGIEGGRPLHQTEIARIVGVNHSTVSRTEKAVRERIEELTPSQLNVLVEAHEAQANEQIEALTRRVDSLTREFQKLETRLMAEITRVESRISP